MKLNLSVSWLLNMFILNVVHGNRLKGVLLLNDLTFDKVVSKFEFSLVKFDTFHPTGEKHATFGDLARQTSNEEDFLMAQVQIKNFGERENTPLAVRMNVSVETEILPEIILYKRLVSGGIMEEGRYGGDFSLDNLAMFLNRKTGIYLAREGCTKSLDELAHRFRIGKTTIEKSQILAQVEMNSAPAEIKKNYLDIMKLMMEKGDTGLDQEKKRIDELLKQRLSQGNKAQLLIKQNVITSFQIRNQL